MKNDLQNDYLAPQLEVIEVLVEQGFADSQLEQPNEETGVW